MSIYTESLNPGKLWLRDAIGDINKASTVLSGIYLKYSDEPTFYGQLTADQITRFDVFYDSIFIQTDSACFFEKIDVDESQSLIPFTKTSFFQPKKTTHVDYWFHEQERIVYFTDIEFAEIGQNTAFVFNVYLYEFDGNSGLTTLVMEKKVDLRFNLDGWNGFVPVIETPKLCHNPDTNTYNISFVFRNKNNNLCLMSLMVRKEQSFDITKIDMILPGAVLDPTLPGTVTDLRPPPVYVQPPMAPAAAPPPIPAPDPGPVPVPVPVPAP